MAIRAYELTGGAVVVRGAAPGAAAPGGAAICETAIGLATGRARAA